MKTPYYETAFSRRLLKIERFAVGLMPKSMAQAAAAENW
jgi:hypothetical protein